MGGKLVLSLVSVIAVAAIAGIGFASYTSSATLTLNASAGSFYLTASGSVVASSLAVGSCYVTGSGSSGVTWNIVNMLPGDYCNFTVTWTDAGSLPGTYVGYSYGAFTGSGCSLFFVTQAWTVAPVATVAAGGTAAAGWVNYTTPGSGDVAGTCAWTNTLTYAAA